MKYYHNLYLSDELASQKKRILYKLEHNKVQLNKYVIVLPENCKHQLEILDTTFFLQAQWTKKDLLVVGIANGFEEALGIVQKVTQEVYEKTQDANIRNYLLMMQKKFEEGKAQV